MLARIAALALTLLWGAAPCMAQQVGPNNIGAGVYGPPFSTVGGHINLGGGPPPTLNAACGTAPVAPNGTDAAFTFTSGTSTSATCTVTFAAPYNSRPTCNFNNQAGSTPAYVVSASGIIVSGVADSQTYHVECFGHPGG